MNPPKPATGAVGAGWWVRCAAFALDWLLISVYALLLAGVSFVVGSRLRSPSADESLDPVLGNLVAFGTLVLPVTLYFALTESGPHQATWGKRKMGLRVWGLDGRPLSRGRALVRAGGKMVPWQLAHTCLFAIPGWPLAPTTPPGWVGVGFVGVWALVGADIIAIVMTPRHQALYDWLAGSLVLRTPPQA